MRFLKGKKGNRWTGLVWTVLGCTGLYWAVLYSHTQVEREGKGKVGTSASNDVNLCTLAGEWILGGCICILITYTPASASAMLEKAKLC